MRSVDPEPFAGRFFIILGNCNLAIHITFPLFSVHRYTDKGTWGAGGGGLVLNRPLLKK